MRLSSELRVFPKPPFPRLQAAAALLCDVRMLPPLLLACGPFARFALRRSRAWSRALLSYIVRSA